MAPRADIMQGTLDLMVLRTLETMGPLHGWGIAQRLEQVSEDALRVNQGTLYPALLRLEQRRLHSLEVGHLREQPPRPLLQPHRQRTPAAAAERDECIALRDHQSPARLGGLTCVPLTWLRRLGRSLADTAATRSSRRSCVSISICRPRPRSATAGRPRRGAPPGCASAGRYMPVISKFLSR